MFPTEDSTPRLPFTQIPPWLLGSKFVSTFVAPGLLANLEASDGLLWLALNSAVCAPACVWLVYPSLLDQRDWRSGRPVHLHLGCAGPRVSVCFQSVPHFPKVIVCVYGFQSRSHGATLCLYSRTVFLCCFNVSP